MKTKLLFAFLFVSCFCYSQRDTVKITTDNQILIPVTINGINTYGMIDTGSKLTFIDVNKIKIFKMKKSFILNMDINGINGTSNNVYQVLRYEIKIGNSNLYSPLATDLSLLTKHIYSLHKIEISIIIGLSYLEMANAIIDIKNKVIIVDSIIKIQ